METVQIVAHDCYLFDMLDGPTVRSILLTPQRHMKTSWNEYKDSHPKVVRYSQGKSRGSHLSCSRRGLSLSLVPIDLSMFSCFTAFGYPLRKLVPQRFLVTGQLLFHARM